MNKLQSKALSLATIAVPCIIIGGLLYPSFTKWVHDYQIKSNISFAQQAYADGVKDLGDAEQRLATAKKDLAQSRATIGKAHRCAEENRKGTLTDCSNDITTYNTASGNTKEMTDHQVSLNWNLNSNNASQGYIELNGNSYFDRSKSLFESLGRPEGEVNIYYSASYKHGIKPEVLLCIAKADSSLGNQLSTKNNPGNVGNNDRGDRVAFATAEEGIEAIAKVLNNKYLGKKQSIGSLSVGGGGTAPYYATSKENWNVNVKNCLSNIYNTPIDEDFMFRL